MVASSKIINVFDTPLCNLHCAQLFHPGLSCQHFILTNGFYCLKTSAIYFLPLLISPMLIKAKTLNKKIIKDAFKFYLQAAICGSSASYIASVYNCIYRNLIGRFYSIVHPSLSFLAILTIGWFFPQRVLKLFTLSTTQASIETLIRVRSNVITKMIFDSKLLQTLVFMINSCIILHHKRLEFYKGFWFITPNHCVNREDINNTSVRKTTQKEQNSGIKSVCYHEEKQCWKYLFNGVKRYMLIGMWIDLLTSMLRMDFSSGPRDLCRMFLTKLTSMKPQSFEMTSFLVANIGIYRMCTCILRCYLNDEWTELLASFLSGASYICSRKLSLSTYSFVVAIQIVWKRLCAQPPSSKQKHYNFQQNIEKFPFSQFIISFNVALLTFYAIKNFDLISSLGRGFLNGTGNYIFRDVNNRLKIELDIWLKNTASNRRNEIF